MSSFKKSLAENFKIIFVTLAFDLPIFAAGGLFSYLIFGVAMPAIRDWSVTAEYVKANEEAVFAMAIIVVATLVFAFIGVYLTIAEILMRLREERRKQRRCEA